MINQGFSTFCDFTDVADARRDEVFPSHRADVGLDPARDPGCDPACDPAREVGCDAAGWEAVLDGGRELDWTGVGGFSATDSGLHVLDVVGYNE